MTDLYFKGDACRYTGRSENLYGGIAFEFIYIEGHKRGDTGWTYKGPSDDACADGASTTK